MAHVVVVGAGLGGLPTAYELRHLLPRAHRITLIADKPEFTFIPGLIRVALNLNPLDEIQLDLEKPIKNRGIEWICGKVTALNPHAQQMTVEGHQTIDYDYIAIATGASFAFDEVSGLGPHGGYTHSVCTPEHALKAREAWLEFLENPGPLVVGAMSGAGCFGPAYEFVLMAERELRRRGLRDRVPVTYITPEPYAGHLGVGGLKNARELTNEVMQERGITVIDNAEVVAIEPDRIVLADNRQFPFQYSMILPSFRGVKFLQNLPEVANARGFVPVLPTCRHPQFPSLYALGVSVQLDQPEKTPVPIGFPKSGEITEAMGIAVAHNIAVELGAINAPLKSPTLEALCFAEFGDTGIAYIAVPVIPDPITGKRKRSYALRGRWVNWVKAAFEQYFMLKMRWGLAVPWFELWGLQAIFG
ncbi:MAG: FAD-dependent oxidoreductase, partial [Cyanobacteriota bacterium]|nr:FAD-dependent oxidoreductase [Cyanobacteriota bacterium]